MTAPSLFEEGLAIHLVARPEGILKREHLALVTLPAPRLAPGCVLVRNLWFAIDPRPVVAATHHWPLHAAVRAGSLIGRVIASRSADMPVGTLIVHREGWASHSILPRGGHQTRVLEPPEGVPTSAYLSILGLPGLAAHVGLSRILRLKPGESLFIAGATDPVGSAAAQLARLFGASPVVGGVDSPQAARVAAQDPSFDAIFERGLGGVCRRASLDAALIGTGGPFLADALKLVREFGRIAWLHGPGHEVSAAVEQPDLSAVHERSILIEGFGLRHHLHVLRQIETRLVGELLAGRLRPGRTEDIGFDGLAEALVDAAGAGFRAADAYRVSW